MSLAAFCSFFFLFFSFVFIICSFQLHNVWVQTNTPTNKRRYICWNMYKWGRRCSSSITRRVKERKEKMCNRKFWNRMGSCVHLCDDLFVDNIAVAFLQSTYWKEWQFKWRVWRGLIDKLHSIMCLHSRNSWWWCVLHARMGLLGASEGDMMQQTNECKRYCGTEANL